MNDAEIGLKADFSVKNSPGKGGGGGRATALTHLYIPKATRTTWVASDQTGQVQLIIIFFNGGNINTFIGIIKLIQAESIIE